MELTEILKQLEFNRGVFPRHALEQAIIQKEQITPALLEIIKKAHLNIHILIDQEDYFAHIYAMYLLAQFREKQAYPLIVDFFSIPGEISLDFTGDLVTEDLCRILASICEGDVTLIERLIENPEAEEYVRKSAMDSLLVLAINGVRKREEVMEYFQTLFREKLEKVPSHAWTGLVSCCTNLYPAEVMDDIKRAFEDELVDEGFIDLSWVIKRYELGQEMILQELKQDPHYQMMGNVIEEMQNWACFKPPTPPKVKEIENNDSKKLRNRVYLSQPLKVEKKVGRNEPCPCGSGKKYKKCCGAVN